MRTLQKVIAIDGPSGAGKSTVAAALAERMDWVHLDTGAMYRAVTWAWQTDGSREEAFAKPTWLQGLKMDFGANGVMVDGQALGDQIRTEAVTRDASKVAANAQVRQFLTRIQREIASCRPCVMEGRDIGTVVFPDAFFKVYLTASAKVRADRRWRQKGGEESGLSRDQILRDQKERDQRDRTRKDAPLRRAEDAFLLETDHLSHEQVVILLHEEATRRLKQTHT